MASPVFFRGGHTPNRTDTIWFIEQRILGALIDNGSGSSGSSGGTYTGTGSPEGVVAAPVGSIYTDTTNPGSPGVWTKTSGGSTSTGWSQIIA